MTHKHPIKGINLKNINNLYSFLFIDSFILILRYLFKINQNKYNNKSTNIQIKINAKNT